MLTHRIETEEDTKERRITPALKAVGWPSSSIWMEYSLRSDRFRIVPEKNFAQKVKPKGRNRPDYLLCRNVNCPMAVIEAKKSSMKAEDGLDQAIVYAKMLDIPFAYASAGEKFLEFNLKTGVLRELGMDQFPTPDQLWRMWCEARGVPDDREHAMANAQYFTSEDGKIPRYYQMVAINRVVNAIVADKRRRALLVMATGTGKTYTAFQIVWRLRRAGVVRNVLYLADRNQLVDQTIVGDFAPFERIQTKIQGGEIDSSHCIYFGLYQQLKGREDGGSGKTFADNFRQVPRNYFDLVIVDECHRGSASEESSWREILEYFEPAIQIGLTATPNKKDGSDNAAYFGDPLYTYSLKQGIEDGFLAPFQVVRVHLDKDRDGWEPMEGEVDADGKPIEQRLYTLDDFDRRLILENRTQTVAEYVTKYLRHIGRMSKTIIFCTTQDHAARMRDAVRRCNRDMVAEEPFYAVRMTGDDDEGRSLYSSFTSPYEPYPVVVTTSKLLTTGADTKCVKLIVLDTPIRSMTEFKQIIGRGTRLREDAGKTFFTILDFRGACELFKDPEFDGEAEVEVEWGEGDPVPKPERREPPVDIEVKPDDGDDGDGNDDGDDGDGGNPGNGVGKMPPVDPEKSVVYRVKNVEVTVVGSSVSFLDESGNLVTAKFRDYTRRNILQLFGSEANFLEVWNGPEEKKAIIERLEREGVLFDQLRKELKNPDADEFDLLCEIAFGKPPMTRQMRASRAMRSRFLDKYQGVARKVLEILISIYAHEGVREVDDIAVLRSEEFRGLGGLPKIVKAFGDKSGYRAAVQELEDALYRPEERSENKNIMELE